ncbi:MAG: adenylate/guanylate cyclase domain-containing protein [Gemmatimonadota bacterium]|jgi:class 3 adenylate cyclase
MEELAVAAGVPAAKVKDMAAAGMLRGSGSPDPTDVARVRFIHALESAGATIDWLADARRRGLLNLEFVDLLAEDTIPLTRETQGSLTEKVGIPPTMVRSIRAVLGTLSSEDGDPVRSDDTRVLEIAEEAHRLGAEENQIARIVRVTAEAANRLVSAQRDFVDEVVLSPAVSRAGSELDALRSTAPARAQYRSLGLELFLVLYRRTVEVAVFQNLLEMTQNALALEGLSISGSPVHPAVAFVDVTGFTRLTEEQGDDAGANVAIGFATLAQEVAADQGGAVVKLLGDGALIRFPDATRAVKGVQALRDRVSREGLPPIHAGIDSGPVVRRDGDVFGTVVNLAARASNQAGPGEILVTEAVVREWTGPELSFEPMGPLRLRGMARPVRLFSVSVPE